MVPTKSAHHRRPLRRVSRSSNGSRSSNVLRNSFVGAILTMATLFSIGFILYLVAVPAFLNQSEADGRFIIAAQSPEQQRANVLVVTTRMQDDPSFVWIDGTKQVELGGSYGMYELRSVVPLLTLEQKDRRFMSGQLSGALRGVITEVVPLGSGFDSLPSDYFEKEPEEQRGELARFFLREAVTSAPRGLTAVLPLLRLHYLFQKGMSLPTQSVVNPDQFSSYITTSPLINTAIADSCPIAIINQTAINGLAQSVGKLIEQERGIVIKLDSAASDQGAANMRSTIQVGKNVVEKCKTIVTLAQALLPAETTLEVVDDDLIFSAHRAEIVLTLGADTESLY